MAMHGKKSRRIIVSGYWEKYRIVVVRVGFGKAMERLKLSFRLF